MFRNRTGLNDFQHVEGDRLIGVCVADVIPTNGVAVHRGVRERWNFTFRTDFLC
jgi:hypothetical protein